MASIILKSGRKKPLLRRHPWIFSNAIEDIEGEPEPGENVQIKSSEDEPLGHGAYSPQSQIRVRIWTFDPDEEVNDAFFARRIDAALEKRQPLWDRIDVGQSHEQNDNHDSDLALRLINAESDGLPGVIVDRYGPHLICQFLTAGSKYWKQAVTGRLAELDFCSGVFERSDIDIRQKEGMQQQSGLLHGEEPPELLQIQENGCRYMVDVREGHKTGFYLDQRDNRALVKDYAEDKDVLNVFSYTGGFGVNALHGGARSVTHVESSNEALELARRNTEINGFDPDASEFIAGDAFHVLRDLKDKERYFDLLILDPPKFVPSRHQLKRGARGYKDINMLAFQLIRNGGILFTFSCSGHMPPDLFQKIVADASLDAGRNAQILRWMHQSEDHPVGLNFPEGTYLKGMICRVD